MTAATAENISFLTSTTRCASRATLPASALMLLISLIHEFIFQRLRISTTLAHCGIVLAFFR
jgi:hypothetical protein